MQDQLSTIAEVAIGLAGFASLATVLRLLSVVFLSLLPPLLLGAGFREATAWRLAAAAVTINVLFAFSPVSPLTRNLKRVRTWIETAPSNSRTLLLAAKCQSVGRPGARAEGGSG